MDEAYIYSVLLVVAGILVSSVIIIFLSRVSNRILHFFQLYPESRSVLRFSLKFISWFVGLIVFLLFLRLALLQLGLEFTKTFVEGLILASPKYILAVIIVLGGFYVSRVLRERSQVYEFEFKDRLMLVLDFIIHMTFVLTALYSIGINIGVFLELYKVVLWSLGLVLALTVSMIIGIPIGLKVYYGMYEKGQVSRHNNRKH